MDNGTVVLRLIDPTWTTLLELGCEEAALSRRVARPHGAPFRRVPFEALCDLVEAGAELTGDPHTGLRLSLPFDGDAHGASPRLPWNARSARR